MRRLLVCFALVVLGAGCLPSFNKMGTDGGAGVGVDVDAGISDDAGVVSPGRYHPDGYSAAAVHGAETKLQKQDCRACHGADLAGGTSGVSCDSCHTPSAPQAWRTNCLFCHGGTQDQTGAPPRSIDGTNDPATQKFPPHHAHVTSTLSNAVDCMQCHVKATDVLSPGHVFDDTPGKAETDFGAGLSKQAVYDGTAKCTNVYCHGDGRGDNGTVSKSDGPRTCASCHASLAAGATAWSKMSGAHSLHLGSTTMGGATCADCHNSVTTDNTTIATPALHVDGLREVKFSATPTAGFAFDAPTQSCTGTCHGYAHSATVWLATAGARFHPAGYAAATAHGPDMELQRQDCRGCHGATLTGGTKGSYDAAPPSCDSCHKAGWRTNCVYCHGGGVNQTGAPPRDLAAAQSTVSQSFRAHTAHVTGTISRSFDCTACHVKPTDVLSMNHAFDSTPKVAEVTMAGGLSAAGVYNGGGSCANMYCHGTGLVNGAYVDGSPTPTCAGCHPGLGSTSTAWGTMSGAHRKHLGLGYTCAECHSAVTTDGTTIAAPMLHVNGAKDVAFLATGFAYSGGRCTGTCHGTNHNFTW
jgi:predicted CxxxxCH...CXXCH cytochrome family protein